MLVSNTKSHCEISGHYKAAKAPTSLEVYGVPGKPAKKIAAGLQPKMTLNPLSSVETVTAYIVQVSLGDTPTGTIEYKTIYVAGMSLFLVTLAFNVFSHWLKKRFREEYD